MRAIPRAFDLSAVSYFADFALVPLVSTALVVLASNSLARNKMAIAIMAGAVMWTLAEYWIHRLVFHGNTRFAPMHQMHHVLPKKLIGVASWGTFVGFGGFWLIASLIVGRDTGAAITAGVMLGYLFYCSIHVRFHHHDEGARLSRYVAFMNDHHSGHHRGASGNFGVSSPIWDLVFNTYKRKP